MIDRRRLFCAALTALSLPAVPQVKDMNDAINKAGRQRMLSQRMAKCYLALGQSVRPEQAETALAESMALFDRQLVELNAFSPTTQIKGSYGQLESAWTAYKNALVGASPSKAGADAVLNSAGAVLQLANQGAGQLEAVSGKAVGRLVNAAGRQRMLSQRMAAMYLSATWGVQPEASVQTMNAARDEFVKAHRDLMQAPESTPVIKAELELVQQQYGFFDAALRGLSSTTAVARSQSQANVFGTSELILKLMDSVTGMYVRLV
jgi:hypothetical protein